MNVLIAEDESATRMRLQRNLEKLGFQATAAENGAEAWKLFQEGEFPLVLTDWMMPEMDGLELVRKIRASGQQQYTYIIMLTSKSEKSELVEGMEAGADDFVSKPFDRNELRVRVRAGQRIIELEQALSLQNQRMKTDLDAAAELQSSLLPSRAPDVAGVSFCWAFRPCDELAGDILGVFKLGDNRIGFYVADVSGHGVAASLLSVSISRMMDPTPSPSSLLYETAPDNGELNIRPACEVLRELNRRFQIEECGGKFFSMAYGILDPSTRKLQLASAGHPPVIRVSKDQVAVALEAEGMLIGVIDDYEFEDCEVQLNPGDRLVAYSDGVVEQLDANDEEFSEKRLNEQLADTRKISLEEAIEKLESSVVAWSHEGHLNDDLSILAMDLT
ncbi:PP2C family protein-serine/threonine phosphatase [Allorhodopirellula solitaria]|uniref:Transcriptional regulatory protein SrrA n=1 Tax=Allorhodopirellula solitaria TaxID=2527987 RepID=A0A5C5XT93_9BACT|nr:SpoIIE family protein phosphatase [Allorhodopirellula solitaria]TWT65225.1 Transcriptional regulatory protein SrrA [Allorhodopirellula solitaria]